MTSHIMCCGNVHECNGCDECCVCTEDGPRTCGCVPCTGDYPDGAEPLRCLCSCMTCLIAREA